MPTVVREKIRATLKDRPRAPEVIAKIARSNTGRRLSDETRSKIAASLRATYARNGPSPGVGRYERTETQREAIAQMNTARVVSEETRARMAEAQRKVWADPVQRQQRLDAQTRARQR
jgi:hypothetical protein